MLAVETLMMLRIILWKTGKSISKHVKITAAHKNTRIANVEGSIASIKESVDKIWMFLQHNRDGTSSPADATSTRNVDHSRGDTSGQSQAQQYESSEFPPLHPAQGDINKSAPIMIVRKFRSSARRLYEDPENDLVSKGILSEAVAERLVSE